MPTLTNEKCTACNRGAPLVTEAEIQELKPKFQIGSWWSEKVFNGWSASSTSRTLHPLSPSRIAWATWPRRKGIIRRFSPNGGG